MIARFKKLIFKNDDVNKFQEETAKTFNAITDVKMLDGFEISVGIINGDVSVDHKLSREISGVIMIRKQGLGDYYVKSSDSQKIVFTGSAAFTARFWVY